MQYDLVRYNPQIYHCNYNSYFVITLELELIKDTNLTTLISAFYGRTMHYQPNNASAYGNHSNGANG